jgi:uncharacterized protein (TIGR02453 family)
MSELPGFSPDLFGFLKDLGENNDREWFQFNKSRYEESVKEPALAFIAAFGPYLNKITPHFQAIPRAQGGSLFRIYRDTRFGKDKSPYKTNTGLHFRHEAGKDAHAPGFYMHLAPGEVFFGAGLWKPEGPTARAIRQLIVDEPAEWEKVKKATGKSSLVLAGESLVRPPRGFDPDHPYIEDIKRKDFLATVELDEATALAPDFLEKTAALCKQAAPLMSFLCHAVDVPF